MKVINAFFKLIITVLAICGACYLFVEIVDRINKDSDDDENDGPGFVSQVKEAAKTQLNRIK